MLQICSLSGHAQEIMHLKTRYTNGDNICPAMRENVKTVLVR